MTATSCGWPLDNGDTCAEPVETAGDRCSEHRRAEAAAKAAQARTAHARRRPAPPEPPPLADEDAAAIFTILDRHQVAYVVIGGMAAAMWGSDLPRTTDADITPAADANNLDRLSEALTELGGGQQLRGRRQGPCLDSRPASVATAHRIDPEDVGLSNRGFQPASGTRICPQGIPDNWRITGTDSAGGTLYYDPSNPGNSVRVMQGTPNSPYANSQAPYVRWQQNGQPLDMFSNKLGTAKDPAAHVLPGDFAFLPEIFQ